MQDQRFCKQDMFVSQAGLTQEDVWWIKQPRTRSGARRATSAPVLAYNPKRSAPSEFSSRGERWHLLHFHLKLLMVATARKRSMGPCTGYTGVVPQSPRELALSNWFSEGMSGWWHFFSRLLLAPAPGNRERSYGWIRSWKDPLIDSMGDVTLGQGAVMEMSPVDLWERSPQKPQSHLLGRRSEENSELIQSFLVQDPWVLLNECTEAHQTFTACPGQYCP